jgi:hypothetical protein
VDLAGTAHEDLDASLGGFELLAAAFAELHAAFEELDGALQRKVARFHFADDLLELLETGFEGERLLVWHRTIIDAGGT